MLSAGIDKAMRRMVYRRDCYECALCGDRRNLTVHHIVKRSQGGPETEMNLITLCPICHGLAHGTDFNDIGKDREEMEQAIVEYMSDLYGEEGIIWNPWSTERVNWKW